MPKQPLLQALLAFALALATSLTAHAAMPAKLKVGDAELKFNGSGERNKFFMQMYLAGLYLSEPSGDGPAIVAADAPMAIRIEITSGLVTQQKLVDALNEGFTSSTGGKTDPLRKEIEQFRGCFAAAIAKGDVFDLVYLPSHGVVVLKNGKRQGAIAGIAFKQALFGIWLGDKPADEKLKLAMLHK